MAADGTWELTGVNELLANLANLNEIAKGKAGRSAMRAAAKVIQQHAIANAMAIDDPETPNKIPINIAVQFNNKLFKATGDLSFRVGVAGGAKFRKLNPGNKKGPGGDTWYWRLVEFGTKDIAARPFIRPALGENTQEATDAFLRRFQMAINTQRRAEKRAWAAKVRAQMYGSAS